MGLARFDSLDEREMGEIKSRVDKIVNNKAASEEQMLSALIDLQDYILSVITDFMPKLALKYKGSTDLKSSDTDIIQAETQQELVFEELLMDRFVLSEIRDRWRKQYKSAARQRYDVFKQLVLQHIVQTDLQDFWLDKYNKQAIDERKGE